MLVASSKLQIALSVSTGIFEPLEYMLSWVWADEPGSAGNLRQNSYDTIITTIRLTVRHTRELSIVARSSG